MTLVALLYKSRIKNTTATREPPLDLIPYSTLVKRGEGLIYTVLYAGYETY